MRRNEALPGQYLAQEDFAEPCLAKVALVVMNEVEGDHGKKDKPVLFISDPSYDVDVLRGIILNGTNWDMLVDMTGEQDSDQWKGLPIVIFVDPNVMFGKKKVGGIRIRPPKQQAAPAVADPVAAPTAAASAEQPTLIDDTDTPF